MRARTLNTAQGRWMTQDPIGFDGGDYNLYRYVANRPTVLTDPSGLVDWPDWPKVQDCVADCAKKGTAQKIASCLVDCLGKDFIDKNCRWVICQIFPIFCRCPGKDPCKLQANNADWCQGCCSIKYYCCLMKNVNSITEMDKCYTEATKCHTDCHGGTDYGDGLPKGNPPPDTSGGQRRKPV